MNPRLRSQTPFLSSATVDFLFIFSDTSFQIGSSPPRQRQLSKMSRWISVWPRGGVTPWWATSHPSYCHTCMLCVCVCVCVCVCAWLCAAEGTSRGSFCANVCVRSVRQMVKYESRLGGTTPAGTPWVCLPPRFSIFHPVFSVSPVSPLPSSQQGVCMHVCVCVCVCVCVSVCVC